MFKKICLLSAILVLLLSGKSFAQLDEGDVAISEFFEELFVYDAQTGSVTDVYDGATGAPSPGQIAVRDGQIYGADSDEFFRFEKGTNTATLIAKLPSTISDVTVDQNGDFLFVASGGVGRIEAETGLVTEVFNDTFFSPDDVVVSSNGDVFVTEFFESLGRIRDGVFTPIGDFGANEFAHVTIGQDGFLYTASTFGGTISRIHPITGKLEIISDGKFASVDDIDVATNGNLLLSARLGSVDGLFSIDPTTGNFINLIDDPSFFSPSDISVARDLNTAIPEPGSALIVLGFGIAVLARRKK